ncbi:MAG: hypothetical protein NPIRA04_05550 [Nitrospirales bacterium]|nr:MAG: hypothetical protein NPIRA04_05550 [Nitrospirales bacterium]
MFATLFVIYWQVLRLFLLLSVMYWALFLIMSLVEHDTLLMTHYQELQSKWNEEPLYTGYLVLLVAGGLYHFIGFFWVMVRESVLWVTGIDSRDEGHSFRGTKRR